MAVQYCAHKTCAVVCCLSGAVLPCAGVAVTQVHATTTPSRIQIVKQGNTVVTGDAVVDSPGYDGPTILRWGDYSGVSFYDGTAWFAVCAALSNAGDGYGTWIFAQDLCSKVE